MGDTLLRRFVLLRHENHGVVHFDLMIEEGDTLATWQFGVSLALLASGGTLSCIRVAQHRPAYLDYEGPVTSGRGTVTRIQSGTCKLLSATIANWDFELHSSSGQGRFQLHHITEANWSLRRQS